MGCLRMTEKYARWMWQRNSIKDIADNDTMFYAEDTSGLLVKECIEYS